ncbi:hypothetical protein [Kingella oralis]|uniref:hypothetical protein n=1 Tax=Kingella oralis TaxID=505 RepID=UPI002D7E1F75|nr:hypothetical protein [Kingella oralis]
MGLHDVVLAGNGKRELYADVRIIGSLKCYLATSRRRSILGFRLLGDWANVPNRVRSQAAHPTRIANLHAFQAASVHPTKAA